MPMSRAAKYRFDMSKKMPTLSFRSGPSGMEVCSPRDRCLGCTGQERPRSPMRSVEAAWACVKAGVALGDEVGRGSDIDRQDNHDDRWRGTDRCGCPDAVAEVDGVD